MAIGSWGQVTAVGGMLDIHPTAEGRGGESQLDGRLIENNLAVHREFDFSGEVRLRRNHDFEEHPLSDGNGCRGVVRSLAGLAGVRAFSGSSSSGTPAQYQRIA